MQERAALPAENGGGGQLFAVLEHGAKMLPRICGTAQREQDAADLILGIDPVLHAFLCAGTAEFRLLDPAQLLVIMEGSLQIDGYTFAVVVHTGQLGNGGGVVCLGGLRDQGNGKLTVDLHIDTAEICKSDV